MLPAIAGLVDAKRSSPVSLWRRHLSGCAAQGSGFPIPPGSAIGPETRTGRAPTHTSKPLTTRFLTGRTTTMPPTTNPSPFLPVLLISIAGGLVYWLWLRQEQKEAKRRRVFMDALRNRPAATTQFTCWLCRKTVVQPVEQLSLEDSMLCTACKHSLHRDSAGAA